MKIKTLMGAIVVAGIMLPASSAMAEDTFTSRSLYLKNVTGTVNIRTINGSKIKVDIDEGAGVVDAPSVALINDVVTVTGEKFRSGNCTHKRNSKDYSTVDARDVAKQNEQILLAVSNGKTRKYNRENMRPLADYPSLTISVPKDTTLEISGGRVFGEVGDVGEADMQFNGCGAFSLGDVAGDLEAQLNGSGDFFIGNVGGKLDGQVNGSGDMIVGQVSGLAKAQVNGSGDLNVDKVGNNLNAQVNGSGDIMVKSINGAVVTQINGSGDINIESGKASSLRAQIIGSGDVTFNGHANDVSGQVMGSGEVTVASYDGEMNIRNHNKRGYSHKNKWKNHKKNKHADRD